MQIAKFQIIDNALEIANEKGEKVKNIPSGSSIWQTQQWTQFLLESGYIEAGFCVGNCFLQKRSLGLGQYGLFCLGGPNKNEEGLADALKDLCKREKCLFVQIEPLNKVRVFSPTKQPYKRFIEPVTALMDLTASEEAILAKMKSKGRYNIKVAAKHEVVVEKVQATSEDIDTFWNLLQVTTARNQFAQNNRQYYERLIQVLEENDWGGLYLAKKDDEVIAAGIFSFREDEAIYYYGASTSDNTKRKYMASYALQWKAIQDAKARGCKTFDFLGVADENGKPSHLAGVTDFKMKFGPDIKTWPETQMWIGRVGIYILFQLIRKLKK